MTKFTEILMALTLIGIAVGGAVKITLRQEKEAMLILYPGSAFLVICGIWLIVHCLRRDKSKD